MFPNASDVLTNNVVMLSVQQVAGCFNKTHEGSAGGSLSHKDRRAFQKRKAGWWRECSRLGDARMFHYNKGTCAASSSSAPKAILACVIACLATFLAVKACNVAISQRSSSSNGAEPVSHAVRESVTRNASY